MPLRIRRTRANPRTTNSDGGWKAMHRHPGSLAAGVQVPDRNLMHGPERRHQSASSHDGEAARRRPDGEPLAHRARGRVEHPDLPGALAGDEQLGGMARALDEAQAAGRAAHRSLPDPRACVDVQSHDEPGVPVGHEEQAALGPDVQDRLRPARGWLTRRRLARARRGPGPPAEDREEEGESGHPAHHGAVAVGSASVIAG